MCRSAALHLSRKFICSPSAHPLGPTEYCSPILHRESIFSELATRKVIPDLPCTRSLVSSHLECLCARCVSNRLRVRITINTRAAQKHGFWQRNRMPALYSSERSRRHTATRQAQRAVVLGSDHNLHDMPHS